MLGALKHKQQAQECLDSEGAPRRQQVQVLVHAPSQVQARALRRMS